jgi:hypothetical protein
MKMHRTIFGPTPTLADGLVLAPGISIGEVFISLRADKGTFERDADAEAAKAGEKAGNTFGDRFGGIVTKLGAGIAAGFGAALAAGVGSRLAELEKATASFRAETGATAEEAERAGQAINRMAGDNLQPLEEIGETMTKVTTDLGLTGDAAEATTGQFLKFAQATGQDASDAVLAFDDILDAWGLTAKDADEIMDSLITSHQEFGGSVTEQQQALARLAPAMKAVNLTWEDGQAILNLFAASGVDSADAATAFTKALGNVESPDELQTLLDDITTTEDAFARADLASELFGKKAGPQLANALAGANLDDYRIDLEEAAGATDAAAEASLTMFDRVSLAAQGFVSDAVALLGQNGPLLQAATSLSSLLGPALTTAWARAAVPMLAAVKASGRAAGIGFVGAFAGGLLAIPILEEAVRQIARSAADVFGTEFARTLGEHFSTMAFFPPLQAIGFALLEEAAKRGAQAGAAFGEGLVSGVEGESRRISGEVWAAMEKALSELVNEGLVTFEDADKVSAAIADMIITPAEEALLAGFPTVIAAAEGLGAAAPEGVAAGIGGGSGSIGEAVTGVITDTVGKFESGRPTLQQGFQSMLEGIIGTGDEKIGLRAWRRELREQFEQTTKDIHFLLTHPKFWNGLARDMEDAMDDLQKKLDRAEQNGNTKRAETLRAGLNVLKEQYQQFTGRAYDAGKKASKQHGAGIEDGSKGPEGSVAIAKDVRTDVQSALHPIYLVLRRYGSATVQAYIDGLNAKRQAAIDAGAGIAKAVGKVFKASSPPTHPLNPMRHIRSWGQATMGAYVAGFADVDAAAQVGRMLSVATAGVGSASLSLGLDPIRVSAGPAVVEHRHTISAEGARELRQAGFDERAIADFLRGANRGASTRYRGF